MSSRFILIFKRFVCCQPVATVPHLRDRRLY
jgi:hypothetical protein